MPVPAGRSTRSSRRSGGHFGSLRHSPRISARSGAGRVERRAKTVIGGSSSMPFGSSASQRRNQRISSGTRSMCGPGNAVAVEPWPQGPRMTRFGQVRASKPRKTMFVYPSAQPATIIVGQTILA